MRTCAIVLAVAVVADLSGCATAVPGVPKYEEKLDLSLKLERSDFATGEVATATLTLRNVSTAAVAGCVGEAKGYNISGTRKSTGRSNTVDHPGCLRRFELAPGQVLEWTEPVEILDVGEGPGRLNAWIQVVDPEHCDKNHGCDFSHISSRFVAVTVKDVK